MRKRLAKKILGRHWKKLQMGLRLRPGDLVSTCHGWNAIVEKIVPCYGQYIPQLIVDFVVHLEGGWSCSIVFCCGERPQTQAEIEDYWRSIDNPAYRQWYENWSSGEKFEESEWGRISLAVQAGKRVFDERGLFLGV